MNIPNMNQQAFTPFPLRARGPIALFDAAIQLYKQYFWVFIGWSAIISSVGIAGALVPMGGVLSFFLTPLAIGSVACGVSAAVRGQDITFGQCWMFTQPRYGALLLAHFIASVLGFLLIVVLVGATATLFILSALLLRDQPLWLQITAGLTIFLTAGTLATLCATLAISWMGLVPVITCMEPGSTSGHALSRATELLKKRWVQITQIMTFIGLAMLALAAILGGVSTLFVGFEKLAELARGQSLDDGSLWKILAAGGLGYTILTIIWTPLYYLILTVFYLDVRVRHEALDLEWAAAQQDAEPLEV